MRPSLAILFFVLSLAHGLASASDPENFRHFIWRFFNEPDFQSSRILFPIEVKYLGYEEQGLDLEQKTKVLSKENWVFNSGPEHYRCVKNCFDIIQYDSFERQKSQSEEVVLAFEGVFNGIDVAYFFRRIKGEWHLIRIDDNST